MKKAQIAMESIMIYGLAILVVMLAIGALMYFDVLDLGSLLPDKCEVKGVSITCDDYGVYTNKVVLQLRNNIGKNIYLTSIDVEGKEGSNDFGMWNCQPAGSTTEVIANGGFKKIDLTCDIKIPAGKKINGEIQIQYMLTGSQIEKPALGSIRATVAAGATTPTP